MNKSQPERIDNMSSLDVAESRKRGRVCPGWLDFILLLMGGCQYRRSGCWAQSKVLGRGCHPDIQTEG